MEWKAQREPTLTKTRYCSEAFVLITWKKKFCGVDIVAIVEPGASS
jgi:hypothetical protein